MLICSSSFKQFSQKVNEKLAWIRLKQLDGIYETNEGTRNQIQTTPKWSQIEQEANPKK